MALRIIAVAQELNVTRENDSAATILFRQFRAICSTAGEWPGAPLLLAEISGLNMVTMFFRISCC